MVGGSVAQKASFLIECGGMCVTSFLIIFRFIILCTFSFRFEKEGSEVSFSVLFSRLEEEEEEEEAKDKEEEEEKAAPVMMGKTRLFDCESSS